MNISKIFMMKELKNCQFDRKIAYIVMETM